MLPAKNKVVDTSFETHDKELRSRGVPLGVYWYGTDESVNEAKEAARVLIRLAKGRSYPLGVFYDTEDQRYQAHMGKKKLTDVVLAFTNYIKDNTNYIAGVYASSSWYKSKLEFNRLKGLIIWEANYGGKNSGKKHNAIWYDSHLHQYTSNHYINGKRFDDNIIKKKWWDIKEPDKPTGDAGKLFIEDMAKQVIAGKWGNGEARKTLLTKAGYNYNEIQKEVNRQLNKVKLLPTSDIAKQVIEGKWGNGQDRKGRLTKPWYNYNTVQDEVNKQLNKKKLLPIKEVAKLVIRGRYGNGKSRKDKLEKEGYNYSEVQKEVNRQLKRWLISSFFIFLLTMRFSVCYGIYRWRERP